MMSNPRPAVLSETQSGRQSRFEKKRASAAKPVGLPAMLTCEAWTRLPVMA